jgi:hypothetical protein
VCRELRFLNFTVFIRRLLWHAMYKTKDKILPMIYNIITLFYSVYLMFPAPRKILPNLPVPHKRLIGFVLEAKDASEQN